MPANGSGVADAVANSGFISGGESGAAFGGGHDDILWAALAWMKYYEYTLSTTGTKRTDLLVCDSSIR